MKANSRVFAQQLKLNEIPLSPGEGLKKKKNIGICGLLNLALSSDILFTGDDWTTE